MTEFKCEICENIFETKFKLQTHYNYHHKSSKKVIHCNICTKPFLARNSLSHHMKIFHGRKPTLKRNIQTIHEGCEDFKCDSCDKSFCNAKYLKTHIQTIHEGHKDHKCESCDKSFTEVGSLKKHIYIIHKGHKDYKCKSCGRSFLRADHLKKHLQRYYLKLEM